MGQKFSIMVFNSPRAKTKTVLEMKWKKELKSSRFQLVRDRVGRFVSIYCIRLTSSCNIEIPNPTPLRT